MPQIYLTGPLAFWIECSPMGLIPGRIILRTQKSWFEVSLLNTHLYSAQIQVKLNNASKGGAIEKGTFDFGRPTYIYIYI